MKQIFPSRSASAIAAVLLFGAALCPAQLSLTWDHVKAKFESADPALKADALGVNQSRAKEGTYAYQHGGASLLDFLNAQSDFRAVQLAYLQLVASYLTAAGQLDLAVGREVIQ